MGFKIAWELPPKKSPLIGINHFLYTRYLILQRQKKPRKQNKNWGGLLLCDEKGQYYTHLISYSGYSAALKELSFYFVLLGPCHAEELFLRNKKLHSWLPPEDTLSLG